MEDHKNATQEKKGTLGATLTSKRVLVGLVCFIALLLAFHAGKAVGYRKARFSYGWGENYHRNFAGPRHGFMHGFEDREFTDAHGTAGKVLTVDAGTIVIKGRDGVEKTILVTTDTSIFRFRDAIAASDLKTDDTIVVIGSPDDQGRITAKFVRVLPPPRGGDDKGYFEQRVR